jgi:putative membrane-bound dehydrogenase-like protein
MTRDLPVSPSPRRPVSRGATLLIILMAAACRKSGPPYSPSEALSKFKIEPGYRIELFASEPNVVSPCAMEIDENGRIYVVEDRGYPLDTSGIGRIILLEDTNGDGLPDRRTVFADRLMMPTGVMRWKKGILVTDAPDVLYLEDTDGDGKADVRKKVLTGFAFTNPQHTVNNPMYGLDNWLYLAHEGPATAIIFKDKFADRGGDIHYADRAEGPVVRERNRNIRFRPDAVQLEALSGPSQFGQSFDDWGHHFTDNNSDHSRHEVVAARYLLRNRDLPVPSAFQQISDHGPAAKVFPIVAHPRFELLTNVGEFTSACGITYWRGSLFVAEPAHCLVHRDVLSDAGSTFLARRPQEGVEFLASTDSWFRPDNFYVGPDGALYVTDFYRLVIEHPEWMSTHFHHSRDLTEGIDRGRIWRITPDPGLAMPKNIRLGSATDQELVAQLANPVIWWRRTAQRLLIDRQATGAVSELVKLFETSPSAVGRLHVLWTLDGLGKLDTALIAKALSDTEPGVRENAIILAEPRPELADRLVQLTTDTNPKVQFQLLETLGNLNTPAAIAARDRLLFDHIEDRWFQTAALSASSDDAPRLYAKASSAQETPGWTAFYRQVSSVIAARQKPAEIQSVLQKVSGSNTAGAEWWRAATLEGLGTGRRARRTKAPPAEQGILLKLCDSPQLRVRRASLRLLEFAGLPPDSTSALQRALATAVDKQADPETRADAISLLALAGPAKNEALFRKLIDLHEPEPVEAAAVRALGRIKGDEIGAFMLKNWRGMTANVRGEAADAMYIEPSRIRMLVAALKSGDVQPWTLAFRHKRRLIMSDDPAIRDAARPLLEQTPADREAVVKKYETALDRKGDTARGQKVFKSICAKCHRLNGEGSEVGPDLGTVGNQPKKVLLEDILMPSRSIAQGYEAYVVETVSGGNYDGVIGAQTSTTVALRHEDGKEDLIQRKDIKNMYVTNLSAMPGDLEKQIDVQQMADLLEYLKNGTADGRR